MEIGARSTSRIVLSVGSRWLLPRSTCLFSALVSLPSFFLLPRSKVNMSIYIGRKRIFQSNRRRNEAFSYYAVGVRPRGERNDEHCNKQKEKISVHFFSSVKIDALLFPRENLTHRCALACATPSRARSGVMGPKTMSRITPWASMKKVAGGPKIR